jgi:hypothetical protein
MNLEIMKRKYWKFWKERKYSKNVGSDKGNHLGYFNQNTSCYFLCLADILIFQGSVRPEGRQ